VSSEEIGILMRLLAAILVGGLIGYERSYHGRPAGFRTHALVCLASTLLMLISVYEHSWMPQTASDSIRMDPTRMAQGIMTGIGFLGAGVIYKEGLSVRGLTTAASVWITAALGILIGIGFYFPAIATTVLVLFILSAFRWIEASMKTQTYARLTLTLRRDTAFDETALRQELENLGFSAGYPSYRLHDGGTHMEYRMMLRTDTGPDLSRLARLLSAKPDVLGYRIAPTGD
jgi:putative Mg2+ transporter-C (MgtC) family protein